MPSGLFLATQEPWILWSWLSTHGQLFVDATVQHIELTAIAVVVAFAISLPLGVAAHRWKVLRNPVFTVFGIFYTIPSIALFVLLIPFTGLTVLTAEIGLVTITAVIGLGGLGELILEGLVSGFRTPLVVASVLSVALALVADLTLAGTQRVAVPWSREA